MNLLIAAIELNNPTLIIAGLAALAFFLLAGDLFQKKRKFDALQEGIINQGLPFIREVGLRGTAIEDMAAAFAVGKFTDLITHTKTILRSMGDAKRLEQIREQVAIAALDNALATVEGKEKLFQLIEKKAGVTITFPAAAPTEEPPVA